MIDRSLEFIRRKQKLELDLSESLNKHDGVKQVRDRNVDSGHMT